MHTLFFLIYPTNIYWVLTLCQTLGNKEYHSQKKKREREMSSSLSTCFSGRIRNWVNTATDIKSITTLHMLWKSKEFIRQLLMASSLNFIWKTFLDCDWAQKFKTIWVREGSVQFSRSVMSDSATPWTSAYQIPLSITNSRSSLKLTSLSWWCHPTISSSVIPFFSTFNLSHVRVFFNESVFHIRWPKYWSFTFNMSPSNEHPGLISFTMDWLDLLAVQGTLKSLL